MMPSSEPRAMARGPRRNAVAWALAMACLVGVSAAFLLPGVSEVIVVLGVLALLIVVIAITPQLPVGLILVALLFARTLTDNSAEGSRQSAAFNPSVGIAVALLVLAVGVAIAPGIHCGWVILPSLMIAAWTGLSIINFGTNPLVWREGVRELSILAVAVLGAAVVERWRRQWILSHAILAVTIVPAVLAIFQFATRSGMLVAGDMRAFGTFSHPNAAAPVFGVSILLCLALLDARGRAAYAILGGIFGYALVSTGSLTGFVATIAMIIAYAMLRPGSAGRKAGIVLFALMVVAVFLLSPLGQERLAEQANFSIEAYGNKDASETSLAWRMYNWSTLLSDLGRSPIIGFGLGTTTTGSTTTGTIPHNEYVRYLYETGVLGLVLLLIAITVLFRALWRAHRRTRLAVSEALISVAIIVGLLLHAISANTVLSTVLMYLVAFLIGGSLNTNTTREHRGVEDDYSADRPTQAGTRRGGYLHTRPRAILPPQYPTAHRRSRRGW